MLTTLALLIPLAIATVTGMILYAPDRAPAALERQYATPPSRFIEVDGQRVHVRDEGRGPALVMIHGLSSNLLVWNDWAERLGKDHRIVRLDLPGHGLTGPDPARRYRWPEMADLVSRVLGELDVDRATVIGNSMGGAVAWQLAARHPERVERLVLMAPVGYPIQGRPPLIFRLLSNPVIGRTALRFTYESAFMDRARGVYGDPARFDEAAGRRDYVMLLREGNRDALVDMLRAGPVPDPRPVMATITAPTLLIWGSADPIVPPTQASRFLRDIRGSRLETIEGAGHVPMAELPEQSEAALRQFLDQA